MGELRRFGGWSGRVALVVTLVSASACGDDASSGPGGGSDGSGGGASTAASSGAGGAGGGATTGTTTAAQSTAATTGTTSTGGGTGGEGEGGSGGEAPVTFLDSYPLDAQFPEGGTYDGGDHAFFVGSLGDGSVHRVDAATGDSEVYFTPTEAGTWWTLGMAVDEERRRLWVCAMDDRREQDEDPPYDGYVWLFDLDTGAREAVFPLSEAAGEATCTDVAVREDGAALVVDRDFGVVYEIDPDVGATLFASSPELEGGLIGQNAAVVLPDQSALLVTVYLPSRLVRVDLDDRSVVDVDISGSFADATFAAGADGMTYADGALYVAFTSELVRLTPVLADWTSVEATEVDVPAGMTDVVATPNGLYLLNGQAVTFALGGDVDPFALTRFTGSF